MSENKTPVLFDTDIGSDIDDAVALAYLVNQPKCALLGVTTVSGKPQVRARLADAVCRAFGRKEVQIHSGAEMPMIVPQRQPEVPQQTVLPDYPHRGEFAPNVAVDFLRQTIRSRPGEITLLSVGPTTNIGLLFALDPEVPGLLKQYVMMGGMYADETATAYGRHGEHNILCDPHAAAIMFAHPAPRVRCVGLDVTLKCRMPADECRERFGRGPLKIVGEMAEEWFRQGRSRITFHDPLAAACIFEPDLCRFEPGRVSVELCDEKTLGKTRHDPRAESKPHEVAADVKVERFFEEYWKTVES